MNDDELTTGECPIWKTTAGILEGGIGFSVFSKRAGGGYGIAREAKQLVEQLSNIEQAKLTTWLVEQRRLGVERPIVDGDVLAGLQARPVLTFSDQQDRLLLGLQEFGVARPGAEFFVRPDGEYNHYRAATDHLMALVEVTHGRELLGLIDLVAKRGFISFDGGNIQILPDGYARLAEIETGGANTRQAFVAMWFADEMKEPWRLGFAPGIRDAGYEPFRIDGKEHNNKIDDEIVAEIKRSRFLIADFTCGAEKVKGKPVAIPRGGVYYEAGLAHGLGMEVIFSCRADRINDLHFDTRQFAHIVWNNPRELRDALYNRIAATVKEAPGAPGRGKSAVDPAPEPPKQPSVRLV